jgi:hypothetical protein
MTEVIIFKVPKAVKEELEQFCKINGYNISDAVRMAIENQFLSPNMKTQAELWNEMLNWKDWVNKKLGEMISVIKESWEFQQSNFKKLLDFLENSAKIQEQTANLATQNREAMKELAEIIKTLAAFINQNREAIKMLTEISEGLLKSQQKIAEDLKLMDARTKLLYDTFIEYLEAKVKQKKET